MRFPRSSGILLHPTSLPGRFGIGDLGPEAYRFADWLAGASLRIWQVLPLGPTGYGDSPYQLFSAFAGNPLLISLEQLAEQGYLSIRELHEAPDSPEDRVDYEAVYAYKIPLLRKAALRFMSGAPAKDRDLYEAFTRQNAWWLDDYGLFMTLKEENRGAVWSRWPKEIAQRDPEVLQASKERFRDKLEAHKFWQFVFFEQWSSLKLYCHQHGIRILGDIPIYVAHDSADVWSHPEYFYLDENGDPALVAGVPPDYFSATGQLWGNPIYRWDVLAASRYRWWIDRIRATLSVVDYIRLDHFRGFEAFWQVPAGEPTAVNGKWVKGPGADLLEALQAELGPLPLIAENLGVITPEVEALREQFGFPGMSVLQFAFGKDPQAPDFRPHNYPRERVAYTGTHDNDTTIGWWNSTAGTDSTRTHEDLLEERAFAKAYLHTDGREINWTFIRTLMASVADMVIFPMQDVLGLGTEARMNLPGRPSGNWRWRMLPGTLREIEQSRLKQLVTLYDR